MDLSTPAFGKAPTRAWFSATIAQFQASPPDVIVGQLATNSGFALLPTQRDSWLQQIAFLKSRLAGLNGAIFFEFSIPRMGRRIDVVLLIGPVVFVVEFKVGAASFDRFGYEQVWDYALDLKNFHEASHDLRIVPILVPTEATASESTVLQIDPDGVYRPVGVCPRDFRADD